MGTRYLAKLVLETECRDCDGTGITHWGLGRKNSAPCIRCGGTKMKRLWYRLGFTHVRSYEEALEKLLVKKNIIAWGNFKPTDKFWLVWGKNAGTSPIDITKVVDWRIREWTAKEIYARDNEEAQRVYDLANRSFDESNPRPTSREQGKLDYLLGN